MSIIFEIFGYSEQKNQGENEKKLQKYLDSSSECYTFASSNEILQKYSTIYHDLIANSQE